MRSVLLLSLMLACATNLAGQGQPAPAKPAAPKPVPAQPAPAQPAPGQPTPQKPATPPAQRRPAQASSRSGIAITVTDMRGGTIPGVRVEILGATERMGDTNASGQINFPGLQAGTYRLRFSGEPVITFEREVALRAGQIADLDITLTPAPPKKEAPPAPAPKPTPVVAAETLGPIGEVQTQSVVDLLDKEFIGRQPRRESLLSCSGNTRTTMLQLNEPLPERLYSNADAVYYVLGGEGTIRINGQENKVATNGVLSVPRGTSHAFTRRGNRPLMLLAVLSGEPCDAAK